MGRHHILLIGIDEYDGGGSLSGCVNDITEVERLLTDHVGIDPACITRLASPLRSAADQLPTRDAIVRELARLAEVAPDDRVLIYYSGHGTQSIVAGTDGKRFSREALLPKDKVVGPYRRYLFDWQLNQQISRIADRAARVTVILDSCASAGVTRDVSGSTRRTADRFFPSNEVYQLQPEDGWNDAPVRGLTAALATVQKVQLVAACRDDERARELLSGQGPAYGLLTQALVSAIESVPRNELSRLRWGRIWRHVEQRVRDINPRQNPYVSGGFGRYMFGFGRDEDADCGYAIVAVPGGYELDVGRIHGVTPGAEIAVYGELPLKFPAPGSPEDHPAGRLVVHEPVQASTAFARPVVPFELPTAARGRLVKAGRDARLRVRLVPYDDAIAGRIAASDLIELVSDADDVDVELVRRDDAWIIADDVHGYGETSIAAELVALGPDRIALVREALEHYHAYSAPIRLARACRDLPGLLQLTVLDCSNRSVSAEEAKDPRLPLVEGGLRASYEISTGTRVCFVAENTSDIALWVTLINCAISGRVQLLGDHLVPAHARHAFWADDRLGAPWAFSLPDDRPAGVDRLIAIGTTKRTASLDHLRRTESFEEILNPRRRVRGGSGAPAALPAERWTSAMTTLRVTAPRGRPQSDLWIWLSGTPDDFTSSAVPQRGTPSTARHRVSVANSALRAARDREVAPPRAGKDTGELSRALGAQLFDTLFLGQLGNELREQQHSSQFVRLRLQLDSPELNALPWEFLYDTSRKDYLALSSEFAVVRSLEPESSPWQPYLLFEQPISVLVLSELADARAPALAVYRTNVVRPAGGLDGIAKVLATGAAHIVQLDARGGSDGTLWLGGAAVPAPEVKRLLANANPRPRVVLLLASHSDIAAYDIGRAGLAEAVIGVRGNVSDTAAALFSEAFYDALARRTPVIRAVTEARRALDLRMPGQHEWGAFTLYHRAGDLAVEPSSSLPASSPRRTTSEDPEIERLQRNLQAIEERLQGNDPRRKLLERQHAQLSAELQRRVARGDS